MADPASEFISVHTLTNRFEGDLLMDALQKEGILAFVRSFEETPYDGLFISQRGWGLIMVPEESADRAKEIIKILLENLKAKAIFTDPSEIDPVLWDQLRKADPHKTCANAQVAFDPETRAFDIPLLNSRFVCDADKELIEPVGEALCDNLDFSFHLSILHYLLEARPIKEKGVWISEKDIPGGELFFRGHHRLPIDNLKTLFGERPELFKAAAAKLGGTPEAMGDLAYRFRVLPRIPLVFVLWEADDEFESELKVLFDETIHSHLHGLDTIWALVGTVSKCIYRVAKGILGQGKT